jgi:hypothetical protein
MIVSRQTDNIIGTREPPSGQAAQHLRQAATRASPRKLSLTFVPSTPAKNSFDKFRSPLPDVCRLLECKSHLQNAEVSVVSTYNLDPDGQSRF